MCKCEASNPRDSYAVAVLKGEQTVGHTCRRRSAFAVDLLVDRTILEPACSHWHLVSQPPRHPGLLGESQVVGYRQKASW